ncbi:glycosyltransferase [Naasia aerilata]|uniref:glycosyltransferase n=1 Tax=Naasia aerilata TaxID=1162966 RepID=UPI003D9B6328
MLAQQGVGSYEVLVGDDASTDATREVIADYARRYPDVIRTVLPEANMGGEGKNLFLELVRQSRGSYLAVLDADDYWISDEKVRIQADHLDAHPDCSMVFHNVLREHEGDGRLDRVFDRRGEPARLGRADLYAYNPVPACSPMFRREVLEAIPSWYLDSPWGDWPLYFFAADAGALDYLPEVLGVYRIHDRGAFSGLARLQQASVDVAFFRVLPVPESGPEAALHARRLGQALAAQAFELLRLGRGTEARAALEESRRAFPFGSRRP